MSESGSRTTAEMEADLRRLDPGSQRFKVLSCARDFKASWLKLAEELTRVREQKAYEGWGYSSFEAYARRELRLRQDTAHKLTRSFVFLRDREPTALQHRAERELPSLDVVDLLSRARERTSVDDEALSEIQAEVFAPDANPTRHSVVKRLREYDPEAFRSQRKPPENDDAEGGDKVNTDADLKKCLVIGERLNELVSNHSQISNASKTGLETLLDELRALNGNELKEAQAS